MMRIVPGQLALRLLASSKVHGLFVRITLYVLYRIQSMTTSTDPCLQYPLLNPLATIYTWPYATNGASCQGRKVCCKQASRQASKPMRCAAWLMLVACLRAGAGRAWEAHNFFGEGNGLVPYRIANSTARAKQTIHLNSSMIPASCTNFSWLGFITSHFSASFWCLHVVDIKFDPSGCPRALGPSFVKKKSLPPASPVLTLSLHPQH